MSLFEALTITIFPIYFHQYLGNPLEEKHSTEGDWRDLATTKLPKLKKLDGKNHLSFFFFIINKFMFDSKEWIKRCSSCRLITTMECKVIDGMSL